MLPLAMSQDRRDRKQLMQTAVLLSLCRPSDAERFV